MPPPGYAMRAACAQDSGIIAGHRAAMFRDMGQLSAEEHDTLLSASTPWIAGLLAEGAYLGRLIEHDGAIVAGGGIWLRELGPVPGCLGVGKWAHLVNVYVEREHRRRGLARWLVKELLAWCETHRMDHVTLAASEEGRALYESLGFVPTADMKLTVQPARGFAGAHQNLTRPS
ncbi:MAG TPA: GNAT family N-acetyltransferase [Bryobacteraceae bacterium]|nr:GNAT family N-acetyltransferase [Bryobacteraceae bacterium]